MSEETFILNVIKKIETLKDDIIVYGFKDGNSTMTHVWWEISVSDFSLYMKDERFKKLSRAYRIAAKAKGINLVFVCGWVPDEKKLESLMLKDNLILNV